MTIFKNRAGLSVLLVLGVMALGSVSAWGNPVKWTLQNVAFLDGGIATGSFVYDASTDTYSSVNITTSGGAVSGATYQFGIGFTGARTFVAVPANSADLTGSRMIQLSFSQLLSAFNSGGTLQIVGGLEGRCTYSNCAGAESFTNQRVLTGSIVGVTDSSTAPMTCTALSYTSGMRAEGTTELIANIVLSCTGGTPTAAGQPVPPADIAVTLNAPITSKVTAANNFTEALLLIDEPNTTLGAIPGQRPLLNCGQSGAPDNGPLGAGVCAIVGTGDPATVYNGAPNGYGSGTTCDGSGGRPNYDSYTCGHPNVFQGKRSNPTTLTFSQVPLDPPGSSIRTLRIRNVRVNAAAFCPSDPYCYANPLIASVSLAGNGFSQTLGGLIPSVPFRTLQTQIVPPSAGSNVAIIRLTEGYQDAWKQKNISFLSGDNSGIRGNQDLENFLLS